MIACDEIEKVLADDDEAMLKAKQRIINYVCNIDLRADWYLNKVDLNQSDYKMFKMQTFDYMDNLQKKNVELKELLKKLKHEGVGWLKLLKEKEEEKEKLKIDLIDLTLEQKNHVKDSKILEESREANLDLKTQLEEAKRIEEALRDQLEEKEVTN